MRDRFEGGRDGYCCYVEYGGIQFMNDVHDIHVVTEVVK